MYKQNKPIHLLLSLLLIITINILVHAFEATSMFCGIQTCDNIRRLARL